MRLVLLALLSVTITSPLPAEEVAIHLLGGNTRLLVVDAGGANIDEKIRVNAETQGWRGELAPYERWARVPLRPGRSQLVGVEFTPKQSGRLIVRFSGPHRVGADKKPNYLPVWIDDVRVTGATIGTTDFEKDAGGWEFEPTAAEKPGDEARSGLVPGPAWFGGGRVLKVWYGSQASLPLNVTAGKKVTILARAGYAAGDTAKNHLVLPEEKPATLKTKSGETIEGVIFDRIGDQVLVRKTGGEVVKLAIADLENFPAWRSKLYPADWQPGYASPDGFFLHDFSYAGYHRGERPIPDVAGPIFDVTKFGADRTGRNDATDAIQRTIDAAQKAGGGVVFLPAGTYRVKPPADQPEGPNPRAVLRITAGKIVLRGEGPGRTFLFNDSFKMNNSAIISVEGGGSWSRPTSPEVKVTADLLRPTTVIPVADASVFKPGDTVTLRIDLTDALVDELDMREYWRTYSRKVSPLVCRDIVAVDPIKNTVTLDAPTRLAFKLRDNPRLHRIAPMPAEIGIEGLSIGMREHPQAYLTGISPRGEALRDTPDRDDWLNTDAAWKEKTDPNNSPESFAYDLHRSHLIIFSNVRDSWIRRVQTYRPPGNTRDVHMLSMGFGLRNSRFVTVQDCVIANTVHVGGGGNGYYIALAGEDCLVRDCTLIRARHAFSHSGPQTSGNVFLNCTLVGSGDADWHMQLSPANLADNITVNDSWITAFSYRGKEQQHGHTTTETVIWNTRGLKYGVAIWDPLNRFIVDSNQFGRGYVIATRGPAPNVRINAPALDKMAPDDAIPDWVEGVGLGATLEPQSLYLDQLRRRLAREKIATSPAPAAP